MAVIQKLVVFGKSEKKGTQGSRQQQMNSGVVPTISSKLQPFFPTGVFSMGFYVCLFVCLLRGGGGGQDGTQFEKPTSLNFMTTS